MDSNGIGASPTTTSKLPATGVSLARSTRTQDILRWLARVTAPLARPLAGRRFLPLWAEVHHVGRTTSRSYSIPVAITASSTHLFIPVPFGSGTQWVQNVLAAGGCTVCWKGQQVRATEAALVGQDEAIGAFNRLERPVIRASGLSTFMRLRR